MNISLYNPGENVKWYNDLVKWKFISLRKLSIHTPVTRNSISTYLSKIKENICSTDMYKNRHRFTYNSPKLETTIKRMYKYSMANSYYEILLFCKREQTTDTYNHIDRCQNSLLSKEVRNERIYTV